MRALSHHGFSLLQISILLTAASLIMVAMLPGQEAGDSLRKSSTTVERMMKIEQATTGFMAANGRRPCPADGQYDLNSHNFGLEAATPGSCTGGTPAAPLGPDAGTGNVVAGVVPTKTLGLPDDYAFDEWGRRITYVVDKRATAKSSCVTLQTPPLNNGNGGITIKNSSSGSIITNTMAAYISHGGDGHGAFPMQGSSVANRINVGSIDADTLVNAGVDGSFAYNAANFTNVKIQKEKTATFDDLLYYAPYQKNTCCIGMACSGPEGFRINGATKNGYLGWPISGDIDGDGKLDLIISDLYHVYVIFGGTSGFPNPLPVSSLNGANGFAIIDSYNGGTAVQLGYSVAVGDFNHDGYDDILIGDGQGDVLIYFGHPRPFNASYDFMSVTDCQMDWFQDDAGVGSAVAMADVNGDGFADAIMGATGSLHGNPTVYVLFGGNKSCTGSTLVTRGSNDISNISSTSSPYKGSRIMGDGAAWNSFAQGLTTGDINGDGLQDIIIGDPATGRTGHVGRLVIVAGQTGTWPSTINVSGLSGLAASSPGPACAAASATCGSIIYNNMGDDSWYFAWPAIGDITGDGIDDIVISPFSQGVPKLNIILGSKAAWNASYNLSAKTSVQLQNSSEYCDSSCFVSSQGYFYFGGVVAIADVNRDGKPDLLVADSHQGSNGAVWALFGPITAARNLGTNPPNGADGMQITCPYANNFTCGRGVNAFDLTGDGKNDIIVGVENGSVTGTNKEGYAYVVYGHSIWQNVYDLSRIY
jgi:hypothetical protein